MISECRTTDTIISDIANGIVKADAVIVPMSIYHSMNNGFAYDVYVNFHSVKEYEETTPFGDKRKYGTINEVKTNICTFILCYMHNGGYNKVKNTVFIDYDVLKSCLSHINKKYKGKKVISPIIGSSIYDGNGDKEKIIKIIDVTCKDVDIILYDYPQKDRKLLIYHKLAELKQKVKDKKITYEEYINERSEIEWVRKNGWITKMPNDYKWHSIKKEKKF